MQFFELNIDGLVGQTHHYAGLSFGNIASQSHKGIKANPKEAALQGLKKMRFLHQLGLKQAVMPPHQRPNLHLLHQLGFIGTDKQAIQRAFQEAPQLLRAAFSASAMWTANAATITPSLDSANRRIHFTPANLQSNLHRHQEASFTGLLLKKIFANTQFFEHHPPLPACAMTSDEGAANHSRLCKTQQDPGIHLFVYGGRSKRYPARQSLEASMAVARAHGLKEPQVVYACQNPAAIDKGVFHNDVIAVANESLLLIHEKAYYQQDKVFEDLQKKTNFELHVLEIPERRLKIAEAVETYLFNSQILSLADKSMLLLAPVECERVPKVSAIIEEILADPTNPLSQVAYLDLRQSMQNGGGPACLRLRVPLNEEELKAMHQGILIDDRLLDTLEAWVRQFYREELSLDDLLDPALIEESFSALDRLTEILGLGSIYPFQQGG